VDSEIDDERPDNCLADQQSESRQPIPGLAEIQGIIAQTFADLTKSGQELLANACLPGLKQQLVEDRPGGLGGGQLIADRGQGRSILGSS
jgi:hypothetical protein